MSQVSHFIGQCDNWIDGKRYANVHGGPEKLDIEVFSALRGVDVVSIRKYVCVVIDVLRASSTILCLMENGADEVRVVGTVGEALELKKKNYVLVGERGDEALEGFDFDNSPYMVAQNDWQGKKVVITTTNGTRALVAVQDAHQVLVGGFRNIDAVADYLRESDRPVGIIPIGHEGEPRPEDEMCAHALHARLLRRPVDWSDIGREILTSKESKLKRRGLVYEEDVKMSLTPNATRIVPVLMERLVLRRQEV